MSMYLILWSVCYELPCLLKLCRLSLCSKKRISVSSACSHCCVDKEKQGVKGYRLGYFEVFFQLIDGALSITCCSAPSIGSTSFFRATQTPWDIVAIRPRVEKTHGIHRDGCCGTRRWISSIDRSKMHQGIGRMSSIR